MAYRGFFLGFPIYSFVILEANSRGCLWQSEKNRPRETARARPAAAVETDVAGHKVVRGGADEYALTFPIILEVGRNLSRVIRKDHQGMTFIEEMIPKMRHALYQDLGVSFPGVHVRTESPNLGDDEYSIFLNEVPIVRGKILEGALLTNENPETLTRYNLPFTTSKNSLGQPSIWVDAKYQEIMQKAGIKFWKPLDVMILHLSYFYRQHAAEFIGIQEVRGILEFIEKSFPTSSKRSPVLSLSKSSQRSSNALSKSRSRLRIYEQS